MGWNDHWNCGSDLDISRYHYEIGMGERGTHDSNGDSVKSSPFGILDVI